MLGVDYGEKRVGIAISDDNGKMAFPKTILPNNLSLIDSIISMSQEENISGIVLGESHDLSGKPNKIMGSIEDFKHSLEIQSGLPVFYEKEFLTSLEARSRPDKSIFNARKVKSIKNTRVDDSAAALILQRYLDRKNNI